MEPAAQIIKAPTRPVLRWHGGKWKLAPWIISHFPPHRVYVEPFGGAASVLLRKPRSYAEVYNDLDEEVVNLFQLLRDPDSAERLSELLRLTPFARIEFRAAYERSNEPLERARNLIIRSFMGFGSNAHACVGKGASSTGFRGNVTRSGTTPAQDWAGYPDTLQAIIERVTGVVIECRPAPEVIARYDGAETLHFVDPPYLPETRAISRAGGGMRGMYTHEMDEADHAELLGALKALKGFVVLSGYAAPLYEDALADWQRFELETYADGARPRTEIVWINPACTAALNSLKPDLFTRQAAEA